MRTASVRERLFLTNIFPQLWWLLFSFLLSFSLVLAQGGTGGAGTGRPRTFRDLAALLVELVNNAFVPLIFALAFLVFTWGVFQYVFVSAEEAKSKGRDFIIWGIVGMFVMVSVWGLVNILLGTFF